MLATLVCRSRVFLSGAAMTLMLTPSLTSGALDAPSSYTAEGPAAIRGVEAPSRLRAHERAEVRVDVAAAYNNPFDPDDVRLDAHLVSPSGRRIEIPGFFSLGYARSRIGDREVLSPTEEDGWRIRFQPLESGEHEFWLTLRDGDSVVESPKQTLRVEPAERIAASDRYVRISEKNRLAFALDDGSGFIPLGMNVAFPHEQLRSYDYEHYWEQLHEHRGNFARVWLAPTFKDLALVRMRDEEHRSAGLEFIDQEAAWRIDHLLDGARDHDVRVMLCIESFNSLRSESGWPAWDKNPLNKANGGPLAQPEAFWTDETSRRLFRNRLRYLVARWGYSPSLFAWELWNEVDLTHAFEKHVDAAAAWHDEMARYLQALDPYDHLVTTSTSTPGSTGFFGGTRMGYEPIDRLPSLDFGQTHIYSYEDLPGVIQAMVDWRGQTYGKPQLVGEFSAGVEPGKWEREQSGVNLHLGLWSGVFTTTPASGMTWWWDSYVDRLDLYDEFSALASFLDGIDIANAGARPIGVDWAARLTSPAAATAPPLRLQGAVASWSASPANRPTTVCVGPNGIPQNFAQLANLMHPARETAMFNPATFEVDLAADGEFVVKVTKVSQWGGAGLKVTVDGSVALHEAFADPNGFAEGGDVGAYEKAYRVPVAAGRRDIVVENDGQSWMFVEYELAGVFGGDRPWYDVRGFVCDAAVGEAAVLGWIRNRDWTWRRALQDEPAAPIPASELTLSEVPAGRYALQWWDTHTGKVADGGVVHCRDGKVTISVPTVERDIAFKLLRSGDAVMNP